jgi:hypothetical protein
MLVVVGADIGAAGRKLASQPHGSLYAFLPPNFASLGKVLIDSPADQLRNRSSRRRRSMPKSFNLPVR